MLHRSLNYDHPFYVYGYDYVFHYDHSSLLLSSSSLHFVSSLNPSSRNLGQPVVSFALSSLFLFVDKEYEREHHFYTQFTIYLLTTFHFITCYDPKDKLMRGCPHGLMVKAMDCGIVVSEFVLQSRYYVHFRANTLGKGMNTLILPAMG